jgi:hypothetical protein
MPVENGRKLLSRVLCRPELACHSSSSAQKACVHLLVQSRPAMFMMHFSIGRRVIPVKCAVVA